MKDYIELTKPRITWLILMSTGVGYYVGHRGPWSVWALLHTVIGTGLVASGTAALNQWYERDADLRMRRTQMRPLPSGRLSADQSLWFGTVLALIGGLELGFGVNWLASGLCISTLLLYLFLYTPMTGTVYMVGAIAMGLVFFYSGVRVSLDRTKAHARRVLLASVLYLPVVYCLMVLDPVRL